MTPEVHVSCGRFGPASGERTGELNQCPDLLHEEDCARNIELAHVGCMSSTPNSRPGGLHDAEAEKRRFRYVKLQSADGYPGTQAN